jgi:imidazolonepropionase-like amidohydrolase
MKHRIILVLLLLGILSPARPIFAGDLILVGGKIYPSPTTQPIENGTILVHDGRIDAVGPSANIKPPRDASVVDCKGLVVTAGFWNSHVHILPPGLLHAEKLSGDQLTSQLEEMLTRWGFTTVFDIASVLANTNVIRRRIESGEVKGPRILTVGEPFWVKTPVYVRGYLEANHINMPEVHSSAEAIGRVRQQLRDGADGIKIFTGSVEEDGVVNMPLELAQVIVAEAHRAAKPVFTHPANDAGIEIALKSGVDVLAHTDPSGDLWNSAFVEHLKGAQAALIPTLTLWDFEGKQLGLRDETVQKWINKGLQQLRAYSEAGGEILFGTDVGYTTHFDTAEEFTLMARAGMSYQQILASLTTNSAARFKFTRECGRVATGMQADLVVLGGDPAKDVTAFSRVRYTIRGGKVVYTAH